MNILASSVRWVMLLSGVLTFTMIYAALAPRAALQSTFGTTLEPGPVTEIVVRNWGALIGIVGAMLVYGAFVPPVRPLVLLVGIVSKLTFIGLVLSQRKQLGRGQARVAILVDMVMVTLFTFNLILRIA